MITYETITAKSDAPFLFSQEIEDASKGLRGDECNNFNGFISKIKTGLFYW